MHPSQIQNLLRPKSTGHGFLLGFLFLVFGLLFIAKLVNYELTVLNYIPERVLHWIAGIGSAVGGLYMMYKTITRNKIVV